MSDIFTDETRVDGEMPPIDSKCMHDGEGKEFSGKILTIVAHVTIEGVHESVFCYDGADGTIKYDSLHHTRNNHGQFKVLDGVIEPINTTVLRYLKEQEPCVYSNICLILGAGVESFEVKAT